MDIKATFENGTLDFDLTQDDFSRDGEILSVILIDSKSLFGELGLGSRLDEILNRSRLSIEKKGEIYQELNSKLQFLKGIGEKFEIEVKILRKNQVAIKIKTSNKEVTF